MSKITALVSKELRLLSRDWQGLAVLFILPAIFILIMSIAMQEAFGERQAVRIDYLLIVPTTTEVSGEFVRALREHPVFRPQLVTAAELPASTSSDEQAYAITVRLADDFARRLPLSDRGAGEPPLLTVVLAPTVKPYVRELLYATLRQAAVKARVQQLFGTALPPGMQDLDAIGAVSVQTRYGIAAPGATLTAGRPEDTIAPPTAVQQNVPAWLIFAMFFVIVPLSTTFLSEKQQGTFLRLQLLNISPLQSLLAKLVPYYAINLLQLLLMVAVGRYLVPLLGGDRLNWPSSFVGLFLIASAVSFAAIGFALLIATLARTSTQATTLGGVFNIIFGAVGGIMVPKFVMPPVMKRIADVSPMSWALEGYLDVFLRHAPWSAVVPESLALLGFGGAMLLLALLLFTRAY